MWWGRKSFVGVWRRWGATIPVKPGVSARLNKGIFMTRRTTPNHNHCLTLRTPHSALRIFMLAFVLLATPWAGRSATKTLILATTTSTRDSGLLDVLIPVFEHKTGYVIKTIAVGSGEALAMGQRG